MDGCEKLAKMETFLLKSEFLMGEREGDQKQEKLFRIPRSLA